MFPTLHPDWGVVRVAGLVLALWAVPFGADASGDSLTLEQALARSLEQNPGLMAIQAEVRAREAGVLRADRGANPELILEAENFAGTGQYAGVEGLETTLGFRQVMELGGKRALRKRAAEQDRQSAEWEFRFARAALEARVRNAFADVLAAQERLAILQSGLDVHRQVLETARFRHQSGKAPATEAMKARMAYSLNHIEIDKANQELRSARISLAANWSPGYPDFARASGDLRAIPVLPSLDSLMPQLEFHPDQRRWEAGKARRRLESEAARADRIPDLSVLAGLRNLREGGENDLAWVAGISLPLPVRSRGQAALQEARHRMTQAEKEQQASANELSARLRTLHQALQARREEIVHLEEELLPESARTLSASREAYALGKLSFLEVLDSQRTLFELNSRHVSSLAAYHRDWNDLHSLTSFGGRPKP